MILRPGSREDSHLAYCLMLEGFFIPSTIKSSEHILKFGCIREFNASAHHTSGCTLHKMVPFVPLCSTWSGSSLGSYICFVSNPDLWIPHLVLLILLQDARIKKLSEDNLTQVLSLQEWGELVMDSRHKRRHFFFFAINIIRRHSLIIPACIDRFFTNSILAMWDHVGLLFWIIIAMISSLLCCMHLICTVPHPILGVSPGLRDEGVENVESCTAEYPQQLCRRDLFAHGFADEMLGFGWWLDRFVKCGEFDWICDL